MFPTPDGRARFFARHHAALAESPDADFPLLLTTGRVSGQWHTRTKTGLVPQLNRLDPAPYLQIHPDDAAALGLRDGQRVEVRSRRGRAVAPLRLDDAISPGTVFMPMHWNELWGERASCNEVTTDTADPISKQPALKHCAVAIGPVGLGIAARSERAGVALPVLEDHVEPASR